MLCNQDGNITASVNTRGRLDSSIFVFETQMYYCSTVVLKLFGMFYFFNKDDYQIYPQYLKWCSFISKTEETIYISYN